MDLETNNLHIAFTLLDQSKPFWQFWGGEPKNSNPTLPAFSIATKFV